MNKKEYNKQWWKNNPEKVREYKRRYREKYPEKHKEERKRWYNKHKDTFLAYKKKYNSLNPEKHRAHSLVAYHLKVGNIQKQLCDICGNDAEAHHEDYKKPLEIIWLCRKHHKRFHS